MSDDSKPPLTPGQRAVRTALAWALETGARALSRAAESAADDAIRTATGWRKRVQDWRRENVGEGPGDLDERAEEELQ